MKIDTASSRTEGLVTLFDLHTGFFQRALDGIAEQDMYNRKETKANHMAWLAGALVTQRFSMAADIRHGLKQTGAELFINHRGIQDEAKYPTAAEYIKDWERITPFSRQALVDIDDAKLDSDFEMEGMKMSWYDLISFTIYREASMIGQLALWRRLLNYPAMRYD